MKLTIDTNWWGKFRIYEGENYDYSYYGYAFYTFWRGDYGTLFNRDKERVLAIRKRYSSRGFFINHPPTYLIELLKSKVNIELKCIDFETGYWTIDKEGDDFDLRSVNEHRKSLFKNNIKIASYYKSGIDQVIEYTESEDVLFLVSLALAFKVNND